MEVKRRHPYSGLRAHISGGLSSPVAHAHAALHLTLGLMTAAPLLQGRGLSDVGTAARCVVACTFLLIAAWMLRTGERLGQLAVLLVILAVAAPTLLQEHIAGETTAGMLISATVLLGARLLKPWLAVANCLLTWAPFALGTLLGRANAEATIVVEDYALATAMALAAVGFVNSLEYLAGQASQASEFTRERSSDLAARAAESKAVAQAQRVLHDDVLGTLHLVMNHTTKDPDSLRGHCRRTAETVSQVLRVTELPANVGESSGRTGTMASYGDPVRRVLDLVDVDVDVDIDAGSRRALAIMPPDRLDALERACLEALRNVHRHAGVSGARLRMRTTRDVLIVTVSDSGVGMSASSRRGFGQTQSIRGAVAAAGGSAEISSAPGKGTTVELTMPTGRVSASVLQRTYDNTVGGLGVLPLATRSVAVPMILVWCLIAAKQSLESDRPVANLCLAAAWAVLSLAVLRRVEFRAPSAAWILGVVVSSVLLQVVGLSLMGPGTLLDYGSWSIGFSAAPLVLFVFVLPVPVALAAIALHPLLVLLATAVEPTLSFGMFPFGAVNAPLTAPVAAMLLGVFVRRTYRATTAGAAEASAIMHQLTIQRARTAAATLYFDYTHEEVLPWLENVARGEVDPLSPAARRQASMLAAAARDDLYAPGFFDEELRRDVARFRERGGSVELRSGLTPGAASRAVGRVLAELLPLSVGRRIIVSPPAGEESRVRISVVPAPRAGHLDALCISLMGHLVADVDDFRAVLLVEDIPVSG